MAVIDVKKLDIIDRLIVGGGVAAFVAAFLPWWGYSGPSHLYNSSVMGWNAGFTAWFGTLLLIGAAGYVLAHRSGAGLPALPYGPAVTAGALAAAGLLLIVIRWATLPRVDAGMLGSIGPRFGMWVALAAGAVELFGAALALRSSGEKIT